MKRNTEATPVVPLAAHIQQLIDYVNENAHLLPQDHNLMIALESIKQIKKHYFDPATLVSINTFAGIYGKKFLGKGKVSTQAIYQQINTGKINTIEIDGVKFINRNVLVNEQQV